MTVEIGKKVPAFKLPATGEQTISLASLKGKNIILYFYPKDNTPGCTTEGQDFRDSIAKFKRQNCVILGVSRDTLKTHENFKLKQKFPFDLLSDTEEELCKLFDVIKMKNMYGKKHLGIERSTFLINSKGVLKQEWRKVKVAGHVDEVLTAVKKLNKETEKKVTKSPATEKKTKKNTVSKTAIKAEKNTTVVKSLEANNEDQSQRLFVLDSNILMHDPSALFRFKEHDLFLPMMVLEELDNNKKGRSEVARNARQTSRFIEELVSDSTQEQIEAGINLNSLLNSDEDNLSSGKLFFQTRSYKTTLPDYLPGSLPDNNILGTTLALPEEFKEHNITLVTKDINLRIKAAALGIKVEDYHNDRVLEDVDLLYKGTIKLHDDFWEQHSQEMDSWLEQGRTFYKLHGPEVKNWYPNAFISSQDNEQPFDALVRSIDGDNAVIETTQDYQSSSRTVWGINARNQEQSYALNLLMDPEVDFVSLIGMAGTGKTLLTLAAGLEQTIEQQLYSEIIMTRVTIPVGEDIGFLPGTEEEKMTPWMGALMDNLEVLNKKDSHSDDPSFSSDWGQAATNDLVANRIKIRSINFMRGRTFLNRYIIIDEAQNLTSHQLKTLITRSGPGTKIVCLGNLSQIDTPYLTETTSGLTYVVDRFKRWEHGGHITLIRGERSRLADFASEAL